MVIVDEIRHHASIAGYVTDAYLGGTIPRAVVQIVALNLRTQTRADGFFYFLDLAPGSYTLDVSVPWSGSRYGTASVPYVAVQNDTEGRPIFDTKANVALTSTRLIGHIIQSNTGQPIKIKGVTVKILGSEEKALTDMDGKYNLSGLRAGTPNVQASAAGYATAVRKVTLTASLETIADFSLAKT
jgi:hypothetical protein